MQIGEYDAPNFSLAQPSTVPQCPTNTPDVVERMEMRKKELMGIVAQIDEALVLVRKMPGLEEAVRALSKVGHLI